jgi:predicted acyl esterase
VQVSETDPPSHLTLTGAPLVQDLDVVGDIELHLDAVSKAPDTAWIVFLQDVDAAGIVTEVTAGYLRASLREVGEANCRSGAPEVRCRTFQTVPIGELVLYRIPLVANARRFKAGHCLRLFVTSDDQNPDSPAMLGFRHASVGTSCLSMIKSSSRLILPVLTHAG